MNDRLFELDAAERQRVAKAISEALDAESDLIFAYLHGSFLTPQPFHDIDVGVLLASPAIEHTRRIVDLADGLSRRVGYPVDVRALNDAPVPYTFHVLQGELLVSHDDSRLASVLERTGRLYLDIEPILKQATREAFAPTS